MSITKDRISSPLEAGASILDSQQLPAPLTQALEYVSSRLARKRLHLSLIVVRKETQIPTQRAPQTPSHNSFVFPSPTRSVFSTGSGSPSRSPSGKSCFSDASSSSDSSASSTLSFSRTQWASLPSSPKDFAATPRVRSPSTPTTPSTPSSVASCSTPTSPNPYGISLLHASTLTPKAEKILQHTIIKAEKKFHIGSNWLSPNTASTPLTQDLIARSLTQNTTLFSSEGLTLLALDSIYTFKCALSTYSRTLSPLDRSFAVDELRRLVLAQGGKRITKAYLSRAYDWLGFSLAALVDVNEGYKTAYGGPERWGGIEVPVPTAPSRPSPPPLRTSFESSELRQMQLAMAYSPQSPSPSREMGEVEVGESAKGRDRFWDWEGSEGLKEDRGPHRRGPMTPNGFEDITPVTKGEWCFLMVGDGWKGKTAAVETC